MTENPLMSSTPSAPSTQTVFSLDKPLSKTATPQAKPKEEEDPIQCICNYPEDNGSTVFCEICKTWQHITCYYPGRETEALQPEFKHSCADCEPRELDRQNAAERMQSWIAENAQLVNGDPHDKKSKKPLPKTHKKKAKPTDLQLNGHPVGAEIPKHGSPHDHPPAKKAKTSHKSSPSVGTLARKRSPSHSAPKLNHHGHPLSPATTPPDLPLDFEIQAYAPQFLARYEEPLDIEAVDTNTDADLKVTNRMALWSRPENGLFWKDTHCEFDDIVQRERPSPLCPPLRVEEIEVPLSRGMVLRWPRLTTPSAISKDVPLIELNGVVGLQKDYCEDPDNRYSELSAPLPFVFFPQHVPLYIDTRKIGSNARHVRRSCRRNARLVTYLSDGSPPDWRFWLVSDRPIAASEEITLGWDFSLPQPNRLRMQRLLGLSDEDTNESSVADIVADLDHSDYETLSQFIKRLMAEYGGCACNRGDDCAFVQFRRQYLEKLQSRPNVQKRKRAKSKPHTISPTSTGHATNSRAASEGRVDEVPDNDNNSTAGSSRSKPPSRDRTPARLGSFDTLGILTEPTNRDKRKVQIAETLFQKSAQEQQPPRKKKRTAVDATTNPTLPKSKGRNSISHTTEKTNGVDERRYVDAGTSGSKAASPASVTSQASANSPLIAVLRHSSVASASRLSPSSTSSNYRDNAVQTSSKLVDGAIWHLVQPTEQSPEPSPQPSPKPRPQRRVISLTMRLMNQKRRDYQLTQQRPASAMDLDSPSTVKSSHSSPSSVHKQLPVSTPASADVDIPMPDAPPTTVSLGETSPSLSNGTGSSAGPIKMKSPQLRVQMPAVPAFTSPASATAVTTPMSANSSMIQSPFSGTSLPSPFAPPMVNGFAATPSPIKKKMSLSEYKNKANKAAATAKPCADTPHPLKTASSPADRLKPTVNGDHEAKDTEKLPADSSLKDTSAALPAA